MPSKSLLPPATLSPVATLPSLAAALARLAELACSDATYSPNILVRDAAVDSISLLEWIVEMEDVGLRIPRTIECHIGERTFQELFDAIRLENAT